MKEEGIDNTEKSVDDQRRSLLRGSVYSAPALVLLSRGSGAQPLPSPCGDPTSGPCTNAANPGPDDQALDEVIEQQGER
ncbi:MAG: hypothetical protein HRU51_08610 [Xanthomonadales bacterium]|nr:hypothetical protein [Xanthomonadales bacterium]